MEINTASATYSPQIRRQSNLEAIWALSSITPLLLLTYPILAAALAAALLINLPAYTPRVPRLLLAAVLLAAVSLMMSSRPVGDSSEDIVGYYAIYETIASGDFTPYFQFGGGFEIAMTSLFYLFGLLLPKLSVSGLILCLSLINSALFICWVEKTFYSKSSETHGRGVVLMGASLLLFNLYFSTQVVRQFPALIMLLFAISATSNFKRFLYVVIAATFHTTAVPFYLIYLLARRGWLGILTIVIFAVGLRLYFPLILSMLDILPDILVEKLAYYVDNTAEYTESDIGSFRLLFLLMLISIVSFVASGFRLNAETRKWHAIPWVAALIHFALLPIPLASLRTTIMIHSIVTGLVAYKMVARSQVILLGIILNVLVLYKMAGYISLTGFVSTAEVLARSVP